MMEGVRDGGRAMGTVLEAVHQLNELRSRQGRIYPLWKLLAIVR